MIKSKRARKSLLVATFIIGLACLGAAGFGLWDYLHVKGQGKSVPDTEILSKTVDNPGEKNPGKVSDDYKVPADQPRVIDIPGLGVTAYVQRVGIDQHNVMVAPDSIFFAGWYVGSIAPGEKGVSIIDGHVSGKYEDGIFRHLTNLKSGDVIRVQMGDNTWREFVVASKNTYPVDDSAKALFADDPSIERELHLITCDGVFNSHTQEYDKRLIVTASRKD